jgi:TonB family protein
MSSPLNKHNNDERSRLVGALTTIIVNVSILCVLLFTVGLTEPHPQITFIALEIAPDEEVPEPIKEVRPTLPPRAPDVYTQRPQERTSSGAKPDVAVPKDPPAPSTVSPEGDVETPVQNQRQIDNRTLYQSDDSGTVTAQAVGERDARTLYHGSSEGQDVNNKADDVSSFSLGGRSLAGSLKAPENKSNKDGIVVVDITVNQAGKVTKATAGARGTTLQDAALWKAAEEAAMKTTFNTNKKAQAVQTGTITYIFKLR